MTAPERTTPDKSTIVRAISFLLRAIAPVAPEVAAAALEAFFRHSRRFPVPERERRWIAAAESGELEAAGRRLPTWSWGHGPTILLAHGWQGRGAQLGAFAMPLVDAGYRVVTWDAPGHGANPGRLSSLPEMIDAVAAAAGAYGPVAGVVAHSVGAAAVTGALARGSAVGRAVFLAPPAEPGAYLELAGAWLGLRPSIAERARRRIERRFSVRMEDLAPLAQAPRMTTPLVVIHDEDDHEVPWRDGSRIAAAWPGARLISTRGLGHRRPLRDPGVIGTVVDYLSPAVPRGRDVAGSRSAAEPAYVGASSSR